MRFIQVEMSLKSVSKLIFIMKLMESYFFGETLHSLFLSKISVESFILTLTRIKYINGKVKRTNVLIMLMITMGLTTMLKLKIVTEMLSRHFKQDVSLNLDFLMEQFSI